jgi:predicted Zn finger-like uncharacterized protein
MYAQCTHCLSWLGVSAPELRGTQGWVRCGHCHQIFVAFESLSDRLPKQGLGVEVNPFLSAPHTGSNAQVRQARHLHTAGNAPVSMSSFLNRPVENEDRQPTVWSTTAVTQFLLSKRRSARRHDTMPGILRDDMEALAKRRRFFRKRLIPTLSSAALCLVLAAQLIWFESEMLVQRYPPSRGFLEMFCGYMRCHVPLRRDPVHIQVVSRQVGMHPEYEGVLRVTATLVNALSHAQPYPLLRFKLFNVNGQIIAARTFLPQEYLASNADMGTGMPPQTPVQIGFDLIALQEAAVSFEFQFL